MSTTSEEREREEQERIQDACKRARERNAAKDKERQERKPFIEIARDAGMLSEADKGQRR